jgi:ABC-type Fe3+-hydroxamate transport system substrate-binding protein
MLFTDQIGRSVSISENPQRIISLVPSQTELLFDLGLEDKILGITKFCIHPKEKVKQITKIGGTKNFHFDTIEALKPDLIIGNKEENYQEGIEKLAEKYPVWISDIYKLTDALAMIKSIGEITNRNAIAQNLIEKIQISFKSLSKISLNLQVAYLIWREPYMAAAQKTFIDAMLHQIGLQNAFADKERYPETTLTELSERQPDYIFLSSEPYPFKEKHLRELQRACPRSKVMLVDGEMFSWYGSRLLKSAAYFKQLLESL